MAFAAPLCARFFSLMIKTVAACLCISIGLGVSAARAQATIALPGITAPASAAKPATPATPTVTPSPAAAPTPIAVSAVAGQAQELATRLGEIQEEIVNDHTLEVDAEDLASLAQVTNSRIRDVRRLLNAKPSLETLRSLQPGWERADRQTSSLTHDLTRHATELDQTLAELASLQALWEVTGKAAVQASAPPEISTRIEDTEKLITTTRAQVEQRSTQALALQAQASDLARRIDQTRDNLGTESKRAVSRLLQRDSQPLWQASYWAGLTVAFGSAGLESALAQLESLAEYVKTNSSRVGIVVVLFAALVFVLYKSRMRVRGWADQEIDLKRAAEVFETPVAMAWVIALVLAALIFVQPPLVFNDMLGLLGIVPIVIIVRRLIEPNLHSILYALAGFYLVDRLRGVAAPAHALSRLILVAELAAAILLLVSTLFDARRAIPATPTPLTRRWRMLRAAGRIACVVALVAVCAEILGFAELGGLMGTTLLHGAYLALVLYALSRVAEGLTTGLLHVPPISYLSMARRHRQLIASRVVRFLGWAAVVLWFLLVIQWLGVWEAAGGLLNDVLAASLHIGSVEISVEKVLGFIIAIVGALWIARFATFVLDEEVYPNLNVERGLSYLISTMLRYTIIVCGLVFGVAALGIDMTKFTILAGAFSVGLGFGLQNIVNNFVSGLIVLFERPMKIGDVVQVGDVMGQVERIGIRASVIRSSNGAEVIIPNGTFISTNLTNWTFSNQSRRVDIQLQVALDSDPDRVKSLLLEAAASHPDVSSEPKPQALLTKLGPDTLEFEVRVWSDAQSDWARVRSDLASAIEAALKRNDIAFK